MYSIVYDIAPDAPVKKRSGGSFLGYIGRGMNWMCVILFLIECVSYLAYLCRGGIWYWNCCCKCCFQSEDNSTSNSNCLWWWCWLQMQCAVQGFPGCKLIFFFYLWYIYIYILGAESNICVVLCCVCVQCLNSYETDISKCQLYMDMLRDCRTNSNTNTNTNLPPSTPQN